jgi:hypothetical protein
MVPLTEKLILPLCPQSLPTIFHLYFAISISPVRTSIGTRGSILHFSACNNAQSISQHESSTEKINRDMSQYSIVASRHGRAFSALLPSTAPRGCGEGLIFSARACGGDIFFINLSGRLSYGRVGICRLGSGKGLFHQSKLGWGIEEVNVPSKLLASEDRLVGLPGNG